MYGKGYASAPMQPDTLKYSTNPVSTNCFHNQIKINFKLEDTQWPSQYCGRKMATTVSNYLDRVTQATQELTGCVS
jgi:hypothetical protein